MASTPNERAELSETRTCSGDCSGGGDEVGRDCARDDDDVVGSVILHALSLLPARPPRRTHDASKSPPQEAFKKHPRSSQNPSAAPRDAPNAQRKMQTNGLRGNLFFASLSRIPAPRMLLHLLLLLLLLLLLKVGLRGCLKCCFLRSLSLC
eukprot:7833684-Pyramimonas_sp.AAC.1